MALEVVCMCAVVGLERDQDELFFESEMCVLTVVMFDFGFWFKPKEAFGSPQ